MTKKEESTPQEQKNENPFVILAHLHRDMSRAFSQQMGISFSRLLLLHELWHTGEISQTELASRLSMEGTLLTRFAKQMEAAGLIARRVDPHDNRFTLVSLAPTGRQMLEHMGTLGDAFEEELANMVRTMKHIQTNLTRKLERHG